MMETAGKWWMRTGFLAFVVIINAVDLLLLRARGTHTISLREVALWSLL